MADPLNTINAGENASLLLELKDEEGANIPLADVDQINLWLVGDKPAKVIKSWTYRGPDNFSEDMASAETGTKIALELKDDETATPGTYALHIQAKFPDTEFITSEAATSATKIENFLKINALVPYSVPLVPADAVEYDDAISDDNDDIVVA